MAENRPQSPEEIVQEILENLQSIEPEKRLKGIARLHEVNYSSEAIRNELEKIALTDNDKFTRASALTALNLPTQRNVRGHFNKVERGNRFVLLAEITEWQKLGILESHAAEVLRRRYDFDIAPATTPKPIDQPQRKPDPVREEVSHPAPPAPEKQAPALPVESDAEVKQPAQVQPEEKVPPAQPKSTEPRPTLMQTLFSETSIKIALYLGAFFVIASAAILAAVSPAARLPVLLIATAIFGGLSVSIQKRLPQPSFALFIVFSFLLPITAGVFKESLDLSVESGALFWSIVSALMAAVWVFGTWLYESRVFSLSAFAALIVAFLRIGGTFDAEAEFYISMMGLAAIAGLVGTWALKEWKNDAFALPLFLAAQLTQVAALGASLTILVFQLIEPSTTPLWNLASGFAWGSAFIFYAVSNLLFPMFFFPWLSAAVLIPIPWFVSIALESEDIGTVLIFGVWGVLLAISGDMAHRSASSRAYSLPVLLSSIPALALAVLSGSYNTEVVMAAALVVFMVYGVLHSARPRMWLWALALFNLVIAYFAFFALPIISDLNIFGGYPLLILSLLFLLPDIFLKADFSASTAWRIPLRVYGALFSIYNFATLAASDSKPLIHQAVIFGVYAIFFTVYSIRYNRAWIGAIATTALAISVVHGTYHFKLDLWLEALSTLSVLYFFGGYALKGNETRAAWRTMLEASGLILGSIVSLVSLALSHPHGGWFIAMIGILYMIQMYSRKQSYFEIGAHIAFSTAAYLILADFFAASASTIWMSIGLVLLSLDLIFSRTYHAPRLLEQVAKGLGGVMVLISSLFMIGEKAGEGNLQSLVTNFAIYTVFFAAYTLIQRKAMYGFISTGYLALTVFYALELMQKDLWLPALAGLSVLYYVVGIAIRGIKTQTDEPVSWSEMMRWSGLILVSIVSASALIMEKPFGGYVMLASVVLYAAELFESRSGWFEAGMHLFAGMAVFAILQEFKIIEPAYYFLAGGLFWLIIDMALHITFKYPRPLVYVVWSGIGLSAIANLVFVYALGETEPGQAAICFGIYAVMFLMNALLYRNPLLGYLPAAYFPLAIFYTLTFLKLDLWLPALTLLAVLYFAAGIVFEEHADWSGMLSNSALTLGSVTSLLALSMLKEHSGWYMAVTAILFTAEMIMQKERWMELGVQVFFSTAAYMFLQDLHVTDFSYVGLVFSLLWLGLDAVLHKTFHAPRPLAWVLRGLGGMMIVRSVAYLFVYPKLALLCFSVYTIFLLAYCLVYQQPVLGYSVTLLFIFTVYRLGDVLGLYEISISIAVVTAFYYVLSQILPDEKPGKAPFERFTWRFVLWSSGLGFGLLLSALTPIRGGISSAIPSAVTATMISAEAFQRRNVWLGFPANGLYLLSYFILLNKLNVDEPQFYSMGAALLGMLQHYLLTRTGSRTGTFIMGMASQLVLLGTTYLQMVNTSELGYFFVLFFQSLAVIVYGIIIRSRSLTFTPIGLVVLSVITILYGQAKGMNTVLVIGCTGIFLLVFGVFAVMLRERITKLSEALSDWRA